MHFPNFLKKINFVCAIISGILICAIAIFSTMEAAIRLTNNTTSWSLDVSCYCMLVALFLSGGYVFQTKGHIAVDFIVDGICKKAGLKVKRVLVVISYIFALGFIFFVSYGLVGQTDLAIKLHKVTYATFQIPIIYLYIVMFVGLFLMTVNIIFIILDVCSGSTEYLNVESGKEE